MKRVMRIPLYLPFILVILGCNFAQSLLGGGEESAAENDDNGVEAGIEAEEFQDEEDSDGISDAGETDSAASITHLTNPGEPQGGFQTIKDHLSAQTAGENRAPGGDVYQLGRYERPFLQDMTYLPYLDIKTVGLNRFNPTWIFLRIEVMSDPLENAGDKPVYGLEMDVDANNRGDFLILAKLPPDQTWTTDGVQIWADLDRQVGGDAPVSPDPAGSANGYEKLLFDEGRQSDPDLAWVRLSPAAPNTIEIAFKNALIGGYQGWLIWLPWTLQGAQDHGLFEFNDHFSIAEAGSPLKTNEHYPLNQLWGIDNTCRGISGLTTPMELIGVCASDESTPSNPGGQQPGNNGQPVTPGEVVPQQPGAPGVVGPSTKVQ